MDGKTKSMKMYLKLHNILVKPVVKHKSETLTWKTQIIGKMGKLR